MPGRRPSALIFSTTFSRPTAWRRQSARRLLVRNVLHADGGHRDRFRRKRSWCLSVLWLHDAVVDVSSAWALISARPRADIAQPASITSPPRPPSCPSPRVTDLPGQARYAPSSHANAAIRTTPRIACSQAAVNIGANFFSSSR
ncbi:hypothetical protein KCP73_22495 [Salmonella enterica subsp. enterica]|nr:hypothetical protein KCP73_22495 [Salmonella enterica subsp. enterica]